MDQGGQARDEDEAAELPSVLLESSQPDAESLIADNLGNLWWRLFGAIVGRIAA